MGGEVGKGPLAHDTSFAAAGALLLLAMATSAWAITQFVLAPNREGWAPRTPRLLESAPSPVGHAGLRLPSIAGRLYRVDFRLASATRDK